MDKDKPIYLFNGMPLQSKYNNNYTRGEKIEIVLQLENDYQNGILSANTLKQIIENKLYGSYTALKILSNMQERGIIKTNPFTNNNKPILPKKTVFDW